jgi:hypothetical protein
MRSRAVVQVYGLAVVRVAQRGVMASKANHGSDSQSNLRLYDPRTGRLCNGKTRDTLRAR